MTNITGTASSAWAALGVQQAVAANNVANVKTADFKASSAANRDNKLGGVSAIVSNGQDTVSISSEAVKMLANSGEFSADVKVMKVANNATKKLLDILA